MLRNCPAEGWIDGVSIDREKSWERRDERAGMQLVHRFRLVEVILGRGGK